MKLFAVSLAAQIGTLPFTAYYFGRVSLVSLLANLIVVPLSGLNVILGVTTVVTSFISPLITSCYASLNKLAIDFLLGFVKMAGNVPFAYVETVHFGLLGAFLYYGCVAIMLHITRPGVVKWGMISALSVLAVFLGQEILEHRYGLLKVTVFDVGQGDAILIESPNHKNILIDAGPRQFKYDAGERTILPLLRRKGITTLDAILVTHSHSDHIGGVPFILDNMSVSRVFEDDVGTSSWLYRKTTEVIRSKGISHVEALKGQRIVIDTCLRLYVFHPSLPNDLHKSLNNTSIVVKLVYGNNSVLLVGDAEKDAEPVLCKRYGRFLATDILKAGHHGSGTSSSAEFLRCVRHTVALVSVGMKNKFGHPSRETLSRFVRFGSQVYRTDRDDVLVFESDGRSWWKQDWRNNSTLGLLASGES